MDNINAKFAWELLFCDPETEEELKPISPLEINGNLIILTVVNKDGSRKWQHTISTEEV